MHTISKNLKHLGKSFLDVIYPRHCIACGMAAEGEEASLAFLCQACVVQLPWVRPPHCPTCGCPYYGELADNRVCPHCRERVQTFRQGRTLLKLEMSARALVYALKYHQGTYLLKDIRKLIRQAPDYMQFLEGSILVPVPLHPLRLRGRGYNQSRLLTECLALETTETSIAELLVRRLDTPSQTGLNRKQRCKNMKNAFALSKKIPLDSSLRYIVVDDVFTTGATLNACCKVLLQAGIETIDVVTLAHG